MFYLQGEQKFFSEVIQEAKGEDDEFDGNINSEELRKRKETRQGKEISFYDAINTLVAHGHDYNSVLHRYSKDEIEICYEKCIRQDTSKNADFIESVMAGIGGAFGGGKEIQKLLDTMRNG